MRHLLFAAAAGLCLWSASASASDRAAIDAVLKLESFGSAALSPDGRWLVYEQRGPYDLARRYDVGRRAAWTNTSLTRVSVEGVASGGTEWLKAADGTGYRLGPWSPVGGRLVVYRYDGDRYELGVAEVESGTVRWTGLTPDLSVTGVTVEWAGPHEVVVVMRPDGSLPAMLRWDGAGPMETPPLWRAMAEGSQPSATALETRDGIIARAPDEREVVALDVRTGGIRHLVKGAVLDLSVAPIGGSIAMRIEGSPLAADPGRPAQQTALTSRGRLILNSTTERGRDVSPDLEIAPHLLRWSPDGEQILVWARRSESRPWALLSVGRDGRVREWRMDGLQAFPDGEEVGQLRSVSADWLGDRPVLRARAGASDRFDWFQLDAVLPPRPLTKPMASPPLRLSAVDTGRWLMTADGRRWRIDRTATKAETGDAGEVEAWAVDNQTPLRLRLNAAPRRSWTLSRGSDGRLRWWGEGPAQASGATCAAPEPKTVSREAAVVLCREGVSETLWLARPGGASDRLASLNFEGLGEVLGERVAIRHLDSSGASVVSALTLPPADRPIKGLVMIVYPGSGGGIARDSGESLRLGLSPPLLAAGGYAVLNAAISDAKGADRFEVYAADAEAALAAVGAARPDLPLDDVALMGHSFGGYAVLGMATVAPRYRSVIAWAGLSDLVGHWGEFGPLSRTLPDEFLMVANQMGVVETGQAAIGGPPWSDPPLYARLSPLMRADRMRAPLLLITADQDFVPMSQAERMFTAAHRQGRRARLVRYWGEGHSNWSPANIRDVYDEIFAWLDDTLGARADVRGGAAPPTS